MLKLVGWGAALGLVVDLGLNAVSWTIATHRTFVLTAAYGWPCHWRVMHFNGAAPDEFRIGASAVDLAVLAVLSLFALRLLDDTGKRA